MGANPLLLKTQGKSLPVGFAIVMEEDEEGEEHIHIEDLGEGFLLPNDDQIFEMVASVIEHISQDEKVN